MVGEGPYEELTPVNATEQVDSDVVPSGNEATNNNQDVLTVPVSEPSDTTPISPAAGAPSTPRMPRILAESRSRSRDHSPYCIKITAHCPHDFDMWRSDVLMDYIATHAEAPPTEVVVAASRQAVAFYGRRSHDEGPPRQLIRDIITQLPTTVQWLGVGPTVHLMYDAMPLRDGRDLIGNALQEYRRRAGRPRRSPPPIRRNMPWVELPRGDRTLGRFPYNVLTGGTPVYRNPVMSAHTPPSPAAIAPVDYRNVPPPPPGLVGYAPPPAAAPAPNPASQGATQVQLDMARELMQQARAMLNDIGAENLGRRRTPNVAALNEAPGASDPSSEEDSTGSRAARRRARRRARRQAAQDSSDEDTPRGNANLHIPKAKVMIPKFKGLGETEGSCDYPTWKHQVENYRRVYHDNPSLLQHVVNSLEGRPISLACTLRGNYTLDDLLALMDAHYKDKRRVEQIKSEFYGLKQRSGEDLTKFAIRIGTLANTIIKHEDFTENEDDLLRAKRSVLYDGMYDSYKSSLHYMVDRNSTVTFEGLLEAARELERRYSSRQQHDEPKKDRAGYAGGSLFPHKKLQGHAVPAKAHAAELVDPATLGEELEESHPESLDLEDDVEDPLLPATSKAQMAGAAKKPVCYVCESETHLMKDCKFVKAIRRLNALEGPTKTASGPQPKSENKGTTTSAPSPSC